MSRCVERRELRYEMLTQAPGSELAMPKGIKYFMDPLHVIREYKSCKLHPNTFELEGLSLLSVWEYIKKERLEGAHNSVVDATAQTDIVAHPEFITFINKTKSIRFITDFFREKDKRIHKSRA